MWCIGGTTTCDPNQDREYAYYEAKGKVLCAPEQAEGCVDDHECLRNSPGDWEEFSCDGSGGKKNGSALCNDAELGEWPLTCCPRSCGRCAIDPPSYKLGVTGEDACPVGYAKIHDEPTCIAAYNYLQANAVDSAWPDNEYRQDARISTNKPEAFGGSQPDALRPSGCNVDTSPTVFLNTHPSGAKALTDRPICQLLEDQLLF